ncbi:MAG: PQQ-dependent dehydrogenase, methanol/ethanol family [Woeseiaceae bacterium]|nr:PQQ-dependent dehydrogenase, methanol/ethanol family [Woeseiaceae bacterium]
MKIPVSGGIWVLLFVLSGCSKDPAPEPQTEPAAPANQATVVDDAAMSDESASENWLAFGRTYSEQRFSPLDQVNAGNVASLGVDWYLDLPNARGLVSTPLVVDGTMYFVESMNRIRAVDASSGEELWTWDPKVYENSDMRIGWEHNRGIGIWKDKVYQATWDGRLIAIDRANGTQVWSQRIYDQGMPLYNTGAPKIFKGKVMIGSGGTESGPNRGYVVAHDAETGEFLWKFYIVPGNPADGFENEAMEMAARTWTGEWWKYGGGGNAWHGFTYDADLDVVYIGTGNGAPWNRKVRSPGGGDNLFLDSIVALDPDTGEYLWHYQNTPGETWDYNSNMDIILADLEIDGKTVKAMMQAPKNGFFYVHDRENRKLLSAETYAEINWATHVDMETGRPVERPGARYEDGEERISPTPAGAHSWHAMSYNPMTGLAYIPVLQISAIYNDEGIDPDSWQSAIFEGDTTAVGWRIIEDRTHVAGSLQARDPVTNTVAWEVPMYGIGNAGTMTTAGNLVLQGRVDGTLRAYNATTGEELWSQDLGLGISAPPVTYSVDGRQYIAVLVGWGGGAAGLGGDISTANGWAYGVHDRRLVAFSLDGETTLPAQPPAAEAQPIEMLQFEIDAAMADQGAYEYGVRCTVCHGWNAISAGMAPDLRASPILASQEAFASVVRDGSLQVNGMPIFEHLSDDELLAIRHYVRREAEKAIE